jgi:hypothetical protein
MPQVADVLRKITFGLASILNSRGVIVYVSYGNNTIKTTIQRSYTMFELSCNKQDNLYIYRYILQKIILGSIREDKKI